MKKSNVVVLLLLIASTTYFLHCNHPASPVNSHIWTIDEKIMSRPQDLIVVSAKFNEKYPRTGGSNIRKLILFDYYNLNNYKIITDSTYLPMMEKFSPDKSKIIFCDGRQYFMDGAGYMFVIYDFKSNTFQQTSSPDYSWTVYGVEPICWNAEGTGFFYTRAPGWVIAYNVRFYDITTNKSYLFSNSHINKVYPLCVINADTIIIFSDDYTMTGQPAGFYFMGMNGNYISRINNPHLLTEYSGSWSKHFDWNKELKLLVYLEHSREPYYTGYRISVTNLDGTYYKNYTIGDYQDLHPVWGPDGKTIIFNRKIIGDDIDVSGKIMIIDCKTGMIREFITPDMIPNCLSLSYPDF